MEYLADPGNELEADSRIVMFSDSSRSTVLQDVQLHTSCSQNLCLKDTFGASQLVLWVNEDQGNISCFADVQLDQTLLIPIEGGNVTLNSLFVITNFADPPTQDLTLQVAGTVVRPQVKPLMLC